jgi:general secretion pathway protein D
MLKVHEPFVDERTNMIALRESQDNIQLAERLVALYDSAEPEVLLEMEVLEISSTSLTNLGVKLPTSVSLTAVAPSTSANGLTLGNIRSLTRNDITLGLGSATVNLQREVGDFSTLANPQLRVKNKEKAKILVGDKVPIVTSTSSTTGFVSDSVNYIDVGLKLEVEPTIYADDDVSIKVGLEVSTLGSSVTTSSGTLAYQIGTRNANTVLRLRDGETQMLAGLISKDESSDSNRIPGLGDLPMVGRLFSSNLDNGSRKELVLAITPHIVRNLRQPSASESELWVGTEAAPKLRPVGGLRIQAVVPSVSAAKAAGAATDSEPGAPAGPALPAAAQLSMQGAHDARLGQPLALAIDLDSATSTRGLPLEIHYDPKLLQWIDAVGGDLFRQGGAETSVSKSDDGAGNLRVGIIRNQATGASGKGTVLTVRFKPVAVGDTAVSVSAATAIGLSGPLPAPLLPQPWMIHVAQ